MFVALKIGYLYESARADGNVPGGEETVLIAAVNAVPEKGAKAPLMLCGRGK